MAKVYTDREDSANFQLIRDSINGDEELSKLFYGYVDNPAFAEKQGLLDMLMEILSGVITQPSAEKDNG